MMSETRDVDLEEGLAILGLLGAMRTEERTEHGEDGQTLVQINVAQFAADAVSCPLLRFGGSSGIGRPPRGMQDSALDAGCAWQDSNLRPAD
jgi:hypothetical protein